MTKLTKEQIEQEQVKFSDYFHTEWRKHFENNGIFNTKKEHLLRKNKKGLFVDCDVKKMFREWLARAELDKGELG